MSELEVLGILEGTDKSSCLHWSWDYLRHYDRILSPFRNRQVNLLEIGCLGGASLRMWKRYFTQAMLIGIDIDPRCKQLEDERTAIMIGSQEDPEFLQAISAQYPPSIIIDDGSHIAHHMITSFEVLFPSLTPGGIYIFEDLAFHFPDGRQYLGADVHKGLSPDTIYEYLSQFIRARSAEILTPAASWGFKRYAFANIDEIMVFGGAIAVRKRDNIDIEQHVTFFDRYLSDNPSPDEVCRYSRFALKHGLPLGPFIEKLESTIQSHPDHDDSRLLKATVLEAFGRSDK